MSLKNLYLLEDPLQVIHSSMGCLDF